ncbi:fam-a protein [Plasmodium chabaudi chabaudi]|uniref:Fam-a protein n=1 Tax=Plasmodium chabaudi chabaudi TaxID=31271 RepID=A0A4V0KA49_PLACU|nr:fam-a protein [Plasmodium chabaudi chabaudi]VTZ69948.1 fam-a protein [Plasmodium chabaudi chabaudi]
MNKIYIQIVFFLLSVSVYLNNKTLATEPASGKTTKTKSKNSYATSEEIYEKNKELLCTNPEETINAINLMNEAAVHLIHHAKSSYKRVGENPIYKAFLYKKKHDNNTDIVKIKYRKNDPNKYNKVVGKLWDPDIKNLVDPRSTKRKIARVYNPNLVIIQQRYKDAVLGRWKYFYALAKKTQISEDKTIIVMTSANIIDHHPSKKEYKNTIIENANLFTTEIDSEEDIRNGKLKKKFLNIGGYIIEKKDKCVLITYVGSIDGHIFF